MYIYQELIYKFSGTTEIPHPSILRRPTPFASGLCLACTPDRLNGWEMLVIAGKLTGHGISFLPYRSVQQNNMG